MTDSSLMRLFEHNNWANEQIIQLCATLSDEQLDAAPQSAAWGSIRDTLVHLVGAQHGYLSLLTLPVESRVPLRPAFADLQEAARRSGEGLLALARDESSTPITNQIQTRDGYLVERWVVMVQAINHATEHREQINSMLSALGVTPPELDGWAFGEVCNAAIPMDT